MYFTQIVEPLEAVLQEMDGVGILLPLHYLMQDFLKKMKMLIVYPSAISNGDVQQTILDILILFLFLLEVIAIQ